MGFLDIFKIRKENRSPMEITNLFDGIGDFLNNDDLQNTCCRDFIYEQMKNNTRPDEGIPDLSSYGRNPENPIRVNSPIGEITYLSRLLTEKGNQLFFHRICSIKTSNNTVDIYELVSTDGQL